MNKKIFIINPRMGLCNQLQSIIKGILLAEKYKRDLYINKFQTDLYSKNLCNIKKVLDIEKINLLLKQQNIHVSLISKLDYVMITKIKKVRNIDNEDNATLTVMNNIIEEGANLEADILDIGNPVSLCIEETFGLKWNDYSNKYYKIISNIQFHDDFYKEKEKIKSKLELTNYICMHLRIEDDALQHFSNCYKMTVEQYNEILLNYYLDKINKYTSSKIYICTGIRNYANNLNYEFYKELINKNSHLTDKNNIIDDYYLQNRELIAIIDLLIAVDSEYFIGCGISSFSVYINSIHINKGKKSDLFTPLDK
jgi:hypothetical protein